MQNFKIFLQEYISNNSARKEWEMASNGFLPLTPSIMKEFEQNIDLAYHTTSFNGLKNLNKIQGQKKTVSTFRKGDMNIAMGARQVAGVLVSLSGISNFDAGKDFNSQLSRNGYKWLDPFKTTKDFVVNNEFTVKINKKMVEYFNIKDRFSIKTAIDSLDGKGKANFVKWYLDESKKLINSELLNKIKNSISKDNSLWQNDEFFLHDIKIKEVHIIKDDVNDPREYPEIKDLIKELGLKFAGYITLKEISEINIRT